MPPAPDGHVARTIIDRYLDGTRLRLRRMTDPATEEVQYKLTHKVPCAGRGAVQGTVTNLYLSADEFERLSSLPSAVLCKTRHSVGALLIDVHDPPLDGLVLAEAEFESDDAAAAFSPPAYAVAEVTDDPRFTGGRLVRMSRADVVALRGEFGLAPTAPR